MTGLTAWTGGLAGQRDPAQPLLTMYDGPARVELSGATTANWVAKSANLLVDGLGGPGRVGLLLPLHWQAVSLLLAAVAADATVVVAAEPAELVGCDAAFVAEAHAAAALDAGVDDVLALSGHPLGAPCGPLPPMVTDYAREVPSYGDGWSGPAPGPARVESGGAVLPVAPLPGLSAADRVLLSTPFAGTDAVGTLLGVLASGAGLVLLRDTTGTDVTKVAADERITRTEGMSVQGFASLR